MKKVLLFVMVLVFSGNSIAADESEAGVPTSPLKIYRGGIGVGVLHVGSDELKKQSKNMVKFSSMNSFSLRERLSLFIDIDYLLPDNNYGADIGFDALFGNTDFRPFAGIGVGGHRFDHGGEFKEDFGPSFTAHLGFLLDLTENVTLQIRAPYHFIMNDANDQIAGLDFAFLFSSKYKNVKKLNYN